MTIVIETEHVPPSANALFRNVPGKGRAKTEAYKQWQTAAGYDFNGKGTHNGPFILVLVIDHKRRGPRDDLDNRIKPTLDLLKKQGVIEDDKYCEEIHARWGFASKGMRIEISPIRIIA